MRTREDHRPAAGRAGRPSGDRAPAEHASAILELRDPVDQDVRFAALLQQNLPRPELADAVAQVALGTTNPALLQRAVDAYLDLAEDPRGLLVELAERGFGESASALAVDRLGSIGADAELRAIARGAIAPQVRYQAALALDSRLDRDNLVQLYTEMSERDQSELNRLVAAERLFALHASRAGFTACLRVLDDPEGTAGEERASQVLAGNADQLTGDFLTADDLDRLWDLFLGYTGTGQNMVRWAIAVVMRGNSHPDGKVRSLLRVVDHSNWAVRDSLDEGLANWAIGAGQPAERAALTRIVVDSWLPYGTDHRRTALSAGILCAVAGGNEAAGRLLNDHGPTDGITVGSLRLLQVEVGGATALAPVLKAVDAEFQEPLKQLVASTQDDWRSSVGAARAGFVARLIMSITTFVIGLALTTIAGWQVIFAPDSANLLGSGVSLGAGLATMFAIVYSGPLRDIQTSVNNLGSYSVAFIAYLHRVSFVRHAFAADYAVGTLDPARLKQFAASIGAASTDAVQMLRAEAAQRDSDPKQAADPR